MKVKSTEEILKLLRQAFVHEEDNYFNLAYIVDCSLTSVADVIRTILLRTKT